MAYLGNRFTIGRLTEHARAGMPPGGVSYRFTSPKSGVLKDVFWYRAFGTEACSPTATPKFIVSIRPDKNGVPSTSILDQAEFGGGSLRDDWGWGKMSLPNGALLTVGNIYHIVASISQWIDQVCKPKIVMFGIKLGGFFGAPDQPFVIPKTQLLDTNLGGAMYDEKFHKAWVPIPHTPIFVLGFEDGSFHGQPYREHRDYSLDFYRNVGQEFTPKKDSVVNAAFIHGRVAWTAPTDRLYASLFNKATNTYLAKNIVMSTPKIKLWGWCRAGFPAPITLKADQTHRLEITSPNSQYTQSYEVKVVTTGYQDPGPEVVATAFENGAVFSRDGGKTWSKEPYFTKGIWDMPYWIK